MNWEPIESVPESQIDEKSADALLYSPKIGIKSGNIKKFPWGVVAGIPGYHGDAVTNWGVTHWMRLPEPPYGARMCCGE